MIELSAVIVGAHTLRALKQFMQATGDTRAPELAVEQAIRFWIEHQDAHVQGYQWKSLFLPDGTQLHMHYRGDYHYARVEGEHIVYQGQRCSPRQFVMAVTHTVRNAWRELWLHCPGDERWHLADTRRRLLRRFPSRPPRRPSHAVPPPLPSAVAQPRSPELAIASTLEAPEPDRIMAASSAWENFFQRHRLHRGDSIRDDQPDLRKPFAPGPRTRRYVPGRPGMPERRKQVPTLGNPFLSGRRQRITPAQPPWIAT